MRKTVIKKKLYKSILTILFILIFTISNFQFPMSYIFPSFTISNFQFPMSYIFPSFTISNFQFPIFNCAPLYGKQYAGTSAAPFLLITPDARSGGMAGVGVSFNDDAAGLSLNPALLGLRDKSQIQALYSERFMGIDYNYLGLAMPIFEKSNAGINLVSLRGEDTYRSGPGIIAGSFDVTDLGLTAGYSHYITNNMIFGGDIKVIRREIESISGNAVGFDAGFLYKDLVNGLNFGASVQNLGTSIDFEQEDFNLPVTAKFGVSYRMKYATVAMDFDKSTERDLRMNVGTEVYAGDILRLRAGYKINNDYSGIDDWTVGFGIKYGIWGLDYAYEQFDELGDVHRIQTSIEWGKVREPKKPEQVPIEEMHFEPTPKQIEIEELKPKFVFNIYHKGTVSIVKSKEDEWMKGTIEKIFFAAFEKNKIIKFTENEKESVLTTELKYVISGTDLKVVGYIWDKEKPNALLRIEKNGKRADAYEIISSMVSDMYFKIFGNIK